MSKPTRFFFLVCLALVGLSNTDTSLQAQNLKASPSEGIGFEAVIAGSYEGEVSGDGVLMLLPEAGFQQKGYYFLADGRGIRSHGVTFVLPRGLTPGKYTLASPSALDIGSVPSVRVDKDLGNSVHSSEKNTSGFLDLIAFPDDENALSGSDVIGRFEFETEDQKGQRISVKGGFSFKVP